MNNGNTIREELNELNSRLDPEANKIPYSVPEGYFEGLAASVLSRIKGEQMLTAGEEIAELSPLLAGISRQLPYSVPDGYFQSNIESLEAFTSDEESLVLSFVNKEMPYEVPAGYFAGIPDQVMEKITIDRARVVPLMKRKWIRLAVAAVITGMIALSGIAYFGNSGGHTKTGEPATVALKKASTEELNDFIKTTTAVDLNGGRAQVTAKKTTNRKESKKLFDDVSDKELDAFLNQVPTDDEEMDLN